MRATVTLGKEANTERAVLHVAFELGEKGWRLAFTTGLGQKPRQRKIGPGDLEALEREIARAKRRFGLAERTRVVTCYEAGMEGFWLHRALEARGIENVVVDSSSIDVKRGRRSAKTDRLDAAALVMKLVRYEEGDRKVWSVVRVPPREAEDLRHNDRELTRLSDERTAIRNGIQGLLKTQGIRGVRLRNFAEQLARLRSFEGEELGMELQARLLRQWERLQLVEEQIKAVEARRQELLAQTGRVAEKARQLLLLRGLGENLSWELSTEIFGWRTFENRRQLGGLVGLVPVPHQSGGSHREQSISKAGRVRLRSNLIEMAWLWLRYQGQSELARWYQRKFGYGGKRLRRIGIVALARRLLIELWRYLETGALPEGAQLKAEAKAA
jgi:transposase